MGLLTVILHYLRNKLIKPSAKTHRKYHHGER